MDREQNYHNARVVASRARPVDSAFAGRNQRRHAMVVIEHAMTHGHTAKRHVAVAVLRSKRLWHTAGAMAFKSDG